MSDHIVLPRDQAQEIFDFLAKCPAGQVFNLIGYLLDASKIDDTTEKEETP